MASPARKFIQDAFASIRAWPWPSDTPDEDEDLDPEMRAEVRAYLTERRAEMCRWLFVVRAGLALGLAGYLALSALATGAAWPVSALVLAATYATANGAVRLVQASTRTEQDVPGRWQRAAPWAYAAIDLVLVAALFGLFGSTLAAALTPGVVLIGALVLVLLVYTLLGHPVLSTALALAALGMAGSVFYLSPRLAAEALPAGTTDAPLRAYLLVEYLSIACLVTCLLALRLRRRLAAHRTELHRRLRADLEAEVEETRRRRLEAVGKLKRDFIMVLSHELRNPVAPLVSSLEVVQQDAAKGRCDSSLVEIAVSSAHQLRHLVDDYTRLAQLLACPPEGRSRRNVPLSPLAEATAARLNTRLGGRLAGRLPNAPPPPRFVLEDLDGCAVASDFPLLHAALHALMRRAAQHARGGGAVTVRGFSKWNEAGFTVHDPDSHLDAGSLASLEDLFAPTEERLYSNQATGLELLLARHALHRLGGRLTGQSDPDHGTTIRCALPVASPGCAWVSEEEVRTLPSRLDGPGFASDPKGRRGSRRATSSSL